MSGQIRQPWYLAPALAVTLLMSACGTSSGVSTNTAVNNSPTTTSTSQAAEPTVVLPIAPFKVTQTPVPAWKTLRGNGAELSLPESYEQMDLEQNDNTLLTAMKRYGPDAERSAQTILQIRDYVALWAVEPQPSNSALDANVFIYSEYSSSAETVENYMDKLARSLSSTFRVIEQSTVMLERYRMGRLLMETTNASGRVRQVEYFTRSGRQTMWGVVYVTSLNAFEAHKAIFEQSIHTFVVIPNN